MKKLLLIIPFFIFLCACNNTNVTEKPITEETYSIFAMDTHMSLTVNSATETENIVVDKITELETLFSVTDENSEIYVLNTQNTANISENTADLLSKSIELCEKTNGALDITIYPALTAWGFTTDSFRVPADEELSKILPLIDYAKIEIDNDKVTIPSGAKIDFGAVAKGYAGDIVVAILEEKNVTSALLSLGGNIQAIGSKPDGTAWNVAIQSPFSEEYLGVLPIIDKVVVTSGGYERYFEGEDGQIYSHIIDPKTAKPVNNGIVSVTIIAESGLYADALSTALFVMGLENAVEFWQKHRDFEAIIVSEEENVYITSGVCDDFTPIATEESNLIKLDYTI